MQNSSQSGRSLVSTIGLLSLALCVLCLCSYWISLFLHYDKMEETTQFVTNFFQKYQEGLPDLVKQKVTLDGPIALKRYELLEGCNEASSMFNRNKIVCKLPLGELDLATSYDDPYLHSDVYVHFNDIHKRVSCEQFLSVGWQNILPAYLWDQNSYIGVISENTRGEIYFSKSAKDVGEDGKPKKPTIRSVKDVCQPCRNSRYCSVQISFELSKSFDKEKFPSELVGDDKGPKEKENEKISKEGDTYTKTNGPFKEVVTYKDSGTFSGATFSGGALQSVYEGTFDARGVTSYTSYEDTDKKNVLQKIDKITYDNKGRVRSYEKNFQKIYLIGTADDCLILDERKNARQFGHCAELFKNEVSALTLNYDENGRLREVISNDQGKNSYTFSYDPVTGKLSSYCYAGTSECYNITEGQDLKDIIRQDIPETLESFKSLYNEPLVSKPDKPRRRKMSVKEAIKYLKKEGNSIGVSFK